MKPTDFRNATWDRIQEELDGTRAEVYAAWQRCVEIHGPITTRRLSQAAGLDLLTLRPRTTELVQMGLLVCVHNPSNPHEGLYRPSTPAEWHEIRDSALRAAPQMEML